MTQYRKERDSMGEVRVPAEALYAAQTQRAVDNFSISGWRMPAGFIRALLLIKSAAAQANAELGVLEEEVASVIVDVVSDLVERDNLMDHFPVDVFQTGSGTSTNMNANEVIATLVTKKLNRAVSPNDHINCSQSSNDVIPTAIQVSAAIAIKEQLIPALQHMIATIRQKQKAVGGIVKTGRTHLMDAVPITFDQSLGGWAAQLDDNIKRLESAWEQLLDLPQGGTAVGTGLNAPSDFSEEFCCRLSTLTTIGFKPASNLVSRISAQDVAVSLSGVLKTTAVSLMKISNDLRWMNSGPLSGLAEIELEALQPGSSIMPAKVNPVIPEATAMVAAKVIGNDGTITLAGQSGNFELNVMLPVIAHCLLESINLLANASAILSDTAIKSFKVNTDRIEQVLNLNPILATALNTEIGYLEAAKIAKIAAKEGRPVVDVAKEETELSDEVLLRLLDPVNLTKSYDP